MSDTFKLNAKNLGVKQPTILSRSISDESSKLKKTKITKIPC